MGENEFELQERESTQNYVKQLVQDKFSEAMEKLGIAQSQAIGSEDAIQALSEPIKELTPSDDIEKVKMIVNQVVRELNKLLS